MSILSFNPFVLTMGYFIKPPIYTLPNKMVFQKGNIGILQKLAQLYYINLTYHSIFGPMYFPQPLFFLIGCPLRSQVLFLLGERQTLCHLLFQLLRPLGVSVTHTLDLIISINFSLSLWSAYFQVTLLCPKDIYAWILILVQFMLPAMPCLMRMYFVLLENMILQILIFIFLLLFLILSGF